jgi:hypothetical protein
MEALLRRGKPGLNDGQWEVVATALHFLSNRGLRPEAIERSRRGVMLADDVGMGKTYQALAILAYIMRYQPRAKVLIVCPSSTLVYNKWANRACKSSPPYCLDDDCGSEETGRLCEGMLPALFGSKRLTRGKKRAVRPEDVAVQYGYDNIKDLRGNGRSRGFRVLITTYHFLKEWPAARRHTWDYIFVEECHHLRTRGGRWNKLDFVVGRNPDARMVFLTATPFQIDHITEIVNVLQFLDRRYPDVSADPVYQEYLRKLNPETIPVEDCPKEATKSLVAQIDIGLRLLQARFQEALQTDDNSVNAVVREVYHLAELDHDRMDDTNYLTVTCKKEGQGVEDYLRQLIIRRYKQRLAKPKDGVKRPLPDKDGINYIELRQLIYRRKREKDNGLSIADIFRVQQYCCGDRVLKRYFSDLKRPPRFNVKQEAMRDILRRVWPRFPFHRKLVVFCRHVHAADAVREAVAQRLRELEKEYATQIRSHWRRRDSDGWPSRLVLRRKPRLRRHGVAVECRRDGRRDTLSAFNRRDSLPLLLIATRRFSEGVDMEKGGCKICVHFEADWNPAVMEQREGRIYRGDQAESADEFSIWVLYVPDTLDQRMYQTSQLRRMFKDFLLGDKALGDALGLETVRRIPKGSHRLKFDLRPIVLLGSRNAGDTAADH